MRPISITDVTMRQSSRSEDFSLSFQEKIELCKLLDRLGVKRAFVVYGQSKLDEISAVSPTTICELKDGYYRTSVITPEQFGMVSGVKEELAGGTPKENAEITRAILDGSMQGTRRNAVILNAGAAIYVAGKADTMEAGIHQAEALIDNGSALRVLNAYIQASNAA